MAINIIDIIRLMNPAIMSLVESCSLLITPMIADIANGKTMLAVMMFIWFCSTGSKPSVKERKIR